MVQVRIIAVGSIKENYFREAIAEYEKRLRAYCRPEIIEIRECRLPDNPGESEIAAALASEAKEILSKIPDRAMTVVLAVEGRQMSSEELAGVLGSGLSSHSSLCFVIGSSYGLDQSVKQHADLLLSFSKQTFPHRLFRVMLTEAVYRSFTIMKGTKYHK